MPIQNALRSPAVQNLAAAATAGLVTLARPGRFPRWARNVLRLTNTAGTAGAVYLARQEGEAAATPGGRKQHAASIGSAVAVATSGLGLITSGLGIAADRKVESFLTGRGVRRPRLVMAVGVIGVVFLVKTVQDAATKRTEAKARALVEQQKKVVRPAGSAPTSTSTPGADTPATSEQ